MFWQGKDNHGSPFSLPMQPPPLYLDLVLSDNGNTESKTSKDELFILITTRESRKQIFLDGTYMLCHSYAATGPNLCIFMEVLGVRVSGRDVRLKSSSLMPSSLCMVPVETLCPCLSLPSSSWECHILLENK